MSEPTGNTPPATKTTFDTRLAYIQSHRPPSPSSTTHPIPRPPSQPSPSFYPPYSSSAPPSRSTTPVMPYPHPAERHSYSSYPSASSPTAPNHPGGHQHRRQQSTSSAPLLHAPSRHNGCVLCGLVRSSSSAPPSPAVGPVDRPGSARSVDEDQVNSATGFGPALSGANGPAGPYHHPFERSLSPVPRRGTPVGGGGGNRVGGREVVYQDREITVLRAEGKERLCADGRHLIVVLNEHMESVYDLSASDIPILSHILDTATQILRSAAAAPSTEADRSRDLERGKGKEKEKVHVGFLGSLMRDPAFPHKHLHAHAYLGPIDTKLPGAGIWRRNVVFGNMNWWSLEDLRAEIREESSNCRTKTGYENRNAPIDRVPNAGIGGSNEINPQAYTDHPSTLPVPPNPNHASSSRPAPHTRGTSRSSPLAQHISASEEASASSASVNTIIAEPRGGSRARGSRDSERSGQGAGAGEQWGGRTSRGSVRRESEDFEAVELDGEVGGREREGVV
ncbi:hypothetical protein IAT38_004420 [Cryptococcus sp. DSM 104549]